MWKIILLGQCIIVALCCVVIGYKESIGGLFQSLYVLVGGSVSILASYGYVYQKPIFKSEAWKVLSIFQILFAIPILYMVNVWSWAFTEMDSLNSWVFILAFDVIFISFIASTFVYGFRSKHLW